MMKKLVTDLKKNEGILCTTENEAKAICRLMDEAGLKGQEGSSYLNDKWWKTYSPAVFYPASGQFGSQDWAEQMGYNLHPASDFMQKKIVGYVLKDDKYFEAVRAITGFDFDFTKVWGGKDPQLCYEKLKEANVLDIFMMPVYEEAYNSPKLPKINGYEGKRVGNLVMYGCAEIPIAYFKNHNGNRQVKSMVLSSGVEINEENMNAIRKYLSK